MTGSSQATGELSTGRTTPGVFRPSNATFFLRHSNTQGIGDESFAFGVDTNLPAAGKWAP
ncbi:MAG TPA: hypothetical protein VNT92_05595 [Acidimicrobiia bacterium]|nr:hypothetical protein [Acidimicrobiia bacterium]